MGRKIVDVIDRLFARVDKTSSDDGCWLWTGCVASNGYGKINDGTGKMVLVHRISYTHFHGPIPEGLYVCHTCDVRNCVNPDHFFIGTHSENMADMHKKGRSGDNRGEKHPMVKLMESDVIEIHHLIRQGTSTAEIARKYGVAQGHISNIKNGRRWSYLTA